MSYELQYYSCRRSDGKNSIFNRSCRTFAFEPCGGSPHHAEHAGSESGSGSADSPIGHWAEDPTGPPITSLLNANHQKHRVLWGSHTSLLRPVRTSRLRWWRTAFLRGRRIVPANINRLEWLGRWASDNRKHSPVSSCQRSAWLPVGSGGTLVNRERADRDFDLRICRSGPAGEGRAT